MNPTNGKIALTFSSEVSSVSTLRSVRCETLPSVSWISVHHRVEDLVDLAGAAHLLDQDRRGAVIVAAVDQVHLAPVARQERTLLHGRVAAADDGDVRAVEEGPVAHRAVGDAAAGKLLLAGNA